MFSRRKRLQRSAFSSALAGRRYSSEHITAVFPEHTCGYAVIVSKKVARLSVTRHRIKRRVLGALRTCGQELPPALILFPRASVLTVDHNHLVSELIHILSKQRH